MAGQKWLIVGANRGLGLGFVEYLLGSHPQDTIFATARNVKAAVKLNGLAVGTSGRLIVLQADMTDTASLLRLAEEIKDSSGSVDRIVINAGVASGRGNIENVSPTDFDGNFSINTIGSHNTIQALHKLVQASKADRKSIAVLSTAPSSLAMIEMIAPLVQEAFNEEHFPFGAYVVSKTALNMLARVWALKLNPAGIAMPVLHPGSVDTDNAKGVADKENFMSPVQSAEALVKVIQEADIAKTKEGILSYDGSVIPW